MYDPETHAVKSMSLLTLTLSAYPEIGSTEEARRASSVIIKHDPENRAVQNMSLFVLTLDTPVPESRPTVWDYDDLVHKPSIAGVELKGDLTYEDLGLPDFSEVPDEALSNEDLDEILDAVDRRIDG